MFNLQRPSVDDLPTSSQLLRATAFAVVAAGAILATIVLPAEYGIDPTGAGRAFGLTQMGETKKQLAIEAAADEARTELSYKIDAPKPVASQAPDAAQDRTGIRSDVMSLILVPGEAAEIKAVMAKGVKLEFDWSTSGGAVNFDTHADAPGISYHGYDKGTNSSGQRGTLLAAFDGSHGWFWRNRSGGTVTITLRTKGAYTEIKRVV